MKIKSVRTRVFEWKGKVVPPQAQILVRPAASAAGRLTHTTHR